MYKPSDPRELAVDLLSRSICSVQVAAVVADSRGIFSWGWNSVGSGFGMHAEDHACKRASSRRLRGQSATIYIVAQRHRNGKTVTSKPCLACAQLIKKYGLKVVYRDAEGLWNNGM